jgi:hypothetical protein
MEQTPPRNRASLRIRGKRFALVSRIEVTPAGLLAIAGLVSSVLLSVAVVVEISAGARTGRLPR